MLKRILVAIVGIPLLLAALFWPGGQPYAAVSALVSVIGVLEMRVAMVRNGRIVSWIGPLVGVLLLNGAAAFPGAATYLIPGLLALYLAMLAGETFSDDPKPVERIAAASLLIFYPGLMAVSLLLRNEPGAAHLSGLPSLERGALWVAVAFVLVWTTDTGAYFIGKAMGKHPLAPRLSPKKTWEGSIGGFLLAALAGLALGRWGNGSLFAHGPLSGLALGALAGVFGQIGDLAESAMKRELKVKDFGGWLPGHGGALDRFDSFLFVGPLVYLWSLFGG
jgi:phosphatidate cytidylyltransferase